MIRMIQAMIFVAGGLLMLLLVPKGTLSADALWIAGTIYIAVGALLTHGKDKP